MGFEVPPGKEAIQGQNSEQEALTGPDLSLAVLQGEIGQKHGEYNPHDEGHHAACFVKPYK